MAIALLLKMSTVNSYLLEGEETSRLIFRNLLKTDFEDWLPFHQNPLSSKHWKGNTPEPLKACEQWFKNAFKRYSDGLGGMNALICKESGQLIGQCGLLIQTVDNSKELEIGYSILPEYWEQGFATEAAKKCKEYAFENNLSQSLISIIHINNIGSQKVAINNGMYMDKTTQYKNNPVYIFRINK